MTFLEKDSLNKLYRFGIALTGNRSDAEDVLHTAIERFLKNKRKNKKQNIEQEHAFLRTIMRNYWYDECRKQKHRLAHVEATQAEFELVNIDRYSLEDVIIDQHDLQKHWAKLSDQQRELLYLHCVLEYSAQEIANELDCPRGTVLARIHRLKKHLQKIARLDSSSGALS